MADFDSTGEVDSTTAVQGLFVHHAPELRGFVLALSPSFDRVDDVMQETFLTVTRKAGDFKAGTNFLAWACAIARFKIYEVNRRHPLETQPLSPEVVEALCASEPEAPPNTERLGHLEECLKKLSPQVRRAMEIRYQQGQKPAEVARQLGWTAESVYVALSRARGWLRDCVARKEQFQAEG